MTPPRAEAGAPRPLRHPIAWGIVSAGVRVAVLVFGLIAAHMSVIDGAELPIVQWFNLHHFSVGTAIANGVVVVFEPLIGAVVIVVVGVLILAATRRMWPPALFLLMTFGTLAGAQVLKWLVQRDRPPLSALVDPPAADPTYSFPSGHTTVATVLVVALLIVVPGGWKWLTGVVGGAVADGVGRPRVLARRADVVVVGADHDVLVGQVRAGEDPDQVGAPVRRRLAVRGVARLGGVGPGGPRRQVVEDVLLGQHRETEGVAPRVGPAHDLVTLIVVAEDEQAITEDGLGRGDSIGQLFRAGVGVPLGERELEPQHLW